MGMHVLCNVQAKPCRPSVCHHVQPQMLQEAGQGRSLRLDYDSLELVCTKMS